MCVLKFGTKNQKTCKYICVASAIMKVTNFVANFTKFLATLEISSEFEAVKFHTYFKIYFNFLKFIADKLGRL